MIKGFPLPENGDHGPVPSLAHPPVSSGANMPLRPHRGHAAAYRRSAREDMRAESAPALEIQTPRGVPWPSSSAAFFQASGEEAPPEAERLRSLPDSENPKDSVESVRFRFPAAFAPSQASRGFHPDTFLLPQTHRAEAAPEGPVPKQIFHIRSHRLIR